MKRPSGGRTARDYTVIVAYDGQRTEDDYFRGWKIVIPPSRLTLENLFVKSGGNVLDAVKKAILKKKKSRDYAEFWCVCDVDDTPQELVNEAEALALSNDIKLCTSSRCFEVWIALHFCYSERAVLNEDEAIAMVAHHHEGYGDPYKTIPFHILFGKTECAIENASKLKLAGCSNPATNMHSLARKLIQNCK